MPVRNIRMGRRSVVGTIPSGKLGRNVWSESTLERDQHILLEFDGNVERFEEQPLKITWTDPHGKERVYTPDGKIWYKPLPNGIRPPPELYEIKYQDELVERREELRPKYAAVAIEAAKIGCRFRVYTEHDIRSILLLNARRLLGFRSCVMDPILSEAALSCLRNAGRTTARELLDAVVIVICDRERAWREILALISFHRIGAELESRALSGTTEVWPLEEVII